VNFSFAKWVSSLRRPARRPIRRCRPAGGVTLGIVSPLEDRTLPTVLGAYSLLEGPAAGSDVDVVVTTGAWSASTSDSWLHTTASGTGNGRAAFSFDANPGATRTGTITIGGETFTITQAASGSTAANPAGVPSINANLYFPGQPAIDSAGTVYIADSAHNQITVYDPATGGTTTLPATGLNNPSAVALDAAGNVYIANTYGNDVRKYDPVTGTTTVLTSGYTVNDTGVFDRPTGVVVDAAGKVYFTVYGQDRMAVYNPADGSTTTLLKGDVLYRPAQLSMDAAGQIYIADNGNNRILKYDPAAGTYAVLVSSAAINRFGGLGVDGRGDVYFTDAGNGAVKVYDPGTAAVTTLLTGLNNPSGVGVTPAGDVVVMENTTQSFRVLPQAYLTADPLAVPAAAGTATVPYLVTSGLAVLGGMRPTSDQSWLTVTGVAGGQVSLSYTTNTGPTPRSANVSLLGRTVTVTQAAAAAVPAVDTPTVTAVSSAAATLGGRLASAGTAAVTKRGVLYARTATNPNPTLGGTGVVEVDDASTATGTFTEAATGLTPGTGYSFVAFATNANGTAYTPVTSFTTLPTVQFAAASQGVAEAGGTPFSVTVTLSAAAATNVSVPFTLGGTAVAGTHYTGVSASPLVIPAGQTSATVTGTLIDNGYETTNRTIVLTLGTPANADLGGTTTHTLTITSDPQPSVSFSAASQTVNASAGSFSVTVTLSAASAEDTTIPFTLGGTAAPGVDYANVSASPLVIPAGQTSATITGTLTADPAASPDPTLTFTLGTPTNAVSGATVTHTLTIHEQAVNPTVVDVGGLEFRTAAGFVPGASGYTASGTVQVGLVPASGQPFVALLALGGGTAIDTAAQTVTNSGAVQAVVSGTPTTLLAGGLNAAGIPALAGAGVTGLTGAAFTVAGVPFTLSALTLGTSANGPAVQLQGRLALPYGLSLDVTGSNRVTIDAAGTTLSGVTAAVPSTSFTLGGVAFSGLTLGATYNAAANRFVLTGGGTATLTTPGGNVALSLSFGQGTTPGIAFTGGSLTTLTAAVGGTFTVRGVTFTAQSLAFSYSTASSTFALAGTATAAAAGMGTLSLTFGHGATPGLVVTNGALASIDTTVGSTFAVSGVTFTTQDLDFSYSATADRYALAGTATAAVNKLGTLGVTFGYGANPGLVLTNGSLTSLDMTLGTDVNVAGVAITTRGWSSATRRRTAGTR
jgi:streptogramin lyase